VPMLVFTNRFLGMTLRWMVMVVMMMLRRSLSHLCDYPRNPASEPPCSALMIFELFKGHGRYDVSWRMSIERSFST
jgi:hypothetical protein